MIDCLYRNLNFLDSLTDGVGDGVGDGTGKPIRLLPLSVRLVSALFSASALTQSVKLTQVSYCSAFRRPVMVTTGSQRLRSLVDVLK